MGASVILQVGAPLHLPFPPRRHHLDVRIESHGVELESHLIVALSRRSVADGIGAGPGSGLDEALGDHWTGKRGSEQVVALIDGIRPQGREHEVGGKLIDEVADDRLGGAGGKSLHAGFLHLLTLPDVGRVGNDFETAVFDQPAKDDGGVETSRVCENNLFHGRSLASIPPPSQTSPAHRLDSRAGAHRRRSCRRERANPDRSIPPARDRGAFP